MLEFLSLKSIKDFLIAFRPYKVQGSSNFNSTVGSVITHPIGHTDYVVLVTPTENPNGYLGEVWVVKSANSFAVFCSGTALTKFDYTVIVK